MTSIIIGFGFIAAGLWGLAVWFQDFVMVLKGIIPISVLLGGIVAVAAGVSSFQTRRAIHEKIQNADKTPS